jgi:chromosome segregation ATPase
MKPEDRKTFDVSVPRPDEATLITDSENALTVAQSIEIDSPEMYQIAADELASIKGKLNRLDTQRKSITGPLDVAKKAVMDLFRRPTEILENAERIVKSGMLNYNNQQRAIQQEADRKARAEAEEERKRQQEEAARKREEAKAAEEAGNLEQAAELEQQAENTEAVAEMITAPVVSIEKPKASGVNVRKTYKARVTDLKALLQAVIEGKVPEMAVQVNETFLNGQARAMKESMKYPGVEVYPEEGISSRRA